MMPTNCENASSNIPSSTADTRSASDHKAVAVGLYGVPGSGLGLSSAQATLAGEGV